MSMLSSFLLLSLLLLLRFLLFAIVILKGGNRIWQTKMCGHGGAKSVFILYILAVLVMR